MQKTGRRVLAITGLGHSLCHVYVLILAGALVPIAESLDVSITEITAIGTICYFLFGLGALPSGIIAMKTSAKFTLKLFFLLSAIASLLTGISDSVMTFTIALAWVGIFGSLYHVSGLTLISQCIEKKGKVLGIHGIAGSIGITLAPITTGVIISAFGWREVYLIMAIPGILGFLFLVFDQHIPDVHPNVEHETRSSNRKGHAWSLFILAVIVMGINGFVYRGFLTILPTYMSQKIAIGHRSSALSGGIIATLILSVGMIGQFVGGYLSDKIKMTRLYLIFLSVSLPFMILMGFADGSLLILSALIFTLFHFPNQPIENHIISAFTPPKFVSSGYGVKFVLTFGVGSFAAAFAGYIADHYDISYVFPVLGLFILLSAVVVSILVWLDR